MSTLSDSNQLKVMGLLDWQHVPPFLFADIPGRSQNYDDPASQTPIPPSLPENMNELGESERSHAMGLYHRRLVHFHYVKNTEEYNNSIVTRSLTQSMLIYRLFYEARAPSEGEPHALKTSLI